MRDASLMPGITAKLLAVLSAVLLHLAVAALTFWSSAQEPQGQAKAAGTGGIEIALGPVGGAADGPKQQQGIEQPQPKEEPKAEPEKTPEPTPKPKPKPVTAPLTEALPPEPEPEPVQERPEQSETPGEAGPEAATPPPATLASHNGKGGTREASNSGSGDNSAGGGLPGATEDYAATLVAWLQQHKKYPRRAERRRQEGTVLLYFVIDRQGRVLEHGVQQSSGYAALDEEVLRMIQRAQPLPAMPDNIDKEQLALVVPVEFFLR